MDHGRQAGIGQDPAVALAGCRSIQDDRFRHGKTLGITCRSVRYLVIMNAGRDGNGEADPETTVEIEIEDLYCAFGDHQVLRGVDLTIMRG